MKRRRFLQIAAATLACPRGARARTWQGTALGADVSVTLIGPGAETTLFRLRGTLDRLEALFSLYRPSALTALNATGTLSAPDPEFLALCRIIDAAHRLTAGRFDPTVQPLWTALAKGGDIAAARASIGWDRARVSPDRVELSPGQLITFNGIAQGFATDVVTAELAATGFSQALVNIGEYRALGGPWRVGIADPTFGDLGQTTLTGRAVATSSPAAILVGGQPHILSRDGTAPSWSTVSVTAPTAAMADALSTAFCLMDRGAIRTTLATLPDTQAQLVDRDGNLVTA